MSRGIVIFGGTGDLAYRKLYPALYNLHVLGALDKDFKIVGVGRRGYSEEEYLSIIEKWTEEFSRIKYTKADFEEFKKRISYVKMDMSDMADYIGLIKILEKKGLREEMIYYYAVSPFLFGPITNGLRISNYCSLDSKVIVEKPFGKTLESAKEIYENLKSAFKEENIYHIDHYLGKEMIINIMTLRFENAIFGGVWNRDYIESVEINAFEEVGVGSRAGYYDKNGALADMIQNHLFQIMSIVSMEKPEDFSTSSIKKAQSNVFSSLKPINEDDIDKYLKKAQYIGYREEENVDPNSTTETYVDLRVDIDNDRWRGVPFYLRTGKKLSKRESEVIVNFKKTSKNAERNTLIIKIQPDEGVIINFNIKKPGNDNHNIQEVSMDFCQSCILENRENTPEAYERLLNAAIHSDKSLFSTWEQIVLSWKFIGDLVEKYKKVSNKLYFYKQGENAPIKL